MHYGLLWPTFFPIVESSAIEPFTYLRKDHLLLVYVDDCIAISKKDTYMW